MIALKQFYALLGFLFAAAWEGFGFGDAILCLLCAGLFYVIAGALRGDLDLGEFQSRVAGRS